MKVLVFFPLQVEVPFRLVVLLEAGTTAKETHSFNQCFDVTSWEKGLTQN